MLGESVLDRSHEGAGWLPVEAVHVGGLVDGGQRVVLRRDPRDRGLVLAEDLDGDGAGVRREPEGPQRGPQALSLQRRVAPRAAGGAQGGRYGPERDVVRVDGSQRLDEIGAQTRGEDLQRPTEGEPLPQVAAAGDIR